MVMHKLYKIAIVIQNHQEVYGNTIEMKQQPMLVTTDVIDNFPGNSASFKLKQKITGKAENNGTQNVDTVVPLKYVRNFGEILECH